MPSSSRPLPAPVRALARRLVRLAAVSLGRTAGSRHLLRLRFGPWTRRWLGGPVIVTWRGVRVEVDPGEAHGFHVFALGDYGGAELDGCLEVCRRARLFVDVGAHIGLFSLAVAHACPDIRVVAVEADPNIAEWFGRNLAHNPTLSSRVTLVRAAASDHEGTVAFVASAGSDNVGTGHVADASSAAGFEVPAIALGGWLAARHLDADVVKIDVEGGELSVLDGLWQSESRPRALFIETHGQLFSDAEAFNSRVLGALAGEGYRVDRLVRSEWTPAVDARALGGRGHVRALLD